MKKTEDGKWKVDTGYIDHRTNDPNRLEPRRSVLDGAMATAAPNAGVVVGQSSKDDDGKFKASLDLTCLRRIEGSGGYEAGSE